MQVFKTTYELSKYLNSFKNKNSIGFVPTMGTLHSGHLSLIIESKKTCKITICSIFVNPTQFNNPTDFENYPNNLISDLQQLEKLSCDIVFTPTTEDIYTKSKKSKKFDFGSLSNGMEGTFRNGHFNGMATIIEKLFKIIKPTKAFFGQKDLQQLQIVKALVKQMDAQIEIIGIKTVRETNGLAKSSRNNLLDSNEKEKASIIYKVLKYCFKNKEKGIADLKLYVHKEFKHQKEIKLEYVEMVNSESMMPIEKWGNHNENAVCIAAYVNGIRLIDNIIL